MEIKNNRLVGVDFRQSPNTAGDLKSKSIITIHDDVGASMAGTSSWILNPVSKVSYHILVGRNGEVIQFVNFNKRAYHAGVSSWKKISDLNWHSVGVCMQNDGKQTYTSAQIEKAVEVCRALVKGYGFKEIVGHRDIAPKRKVDPNDHFPWPYFRSKVFEDRPGEVFSQEIKKVTAPSGLILRSSPKADGDKNRVTALKLGTEVHVLGDEENGWSRVYVCDIKMHGWVATRYIG